MEREMTLGTQLKKRIRKPRTQKQVAMGWLTRAQKMGIETEPSTIESQMSRLLNDEPLGVRCFFITRDRGRLLFDELDVPDADREALFTLAERQLKDGGAIPARLIVDVAGLDDTSDAKTLFNALRPLLVAPTRPVGPVVLIVSQSQYDDLPRTFDEADGLKVERFDTAVAAEARARTLAGDHAAVISPWRFDACDRWIAIEYIGEELVLEPKDGLEAAAAGRPIDWPSIAHNLTSVADETPPIGARKLEVPSSPVALRATLAALRDPARAERLSASPALRLELARTLNAEATSTERDRIEADVRLAEATVGAKATAATDAELQGLLARAQRRVVAMTVLRVGDTLHVVNPSETASKAAHPRVQLHRFEPVVSAVTRVLDALRQYTRDDFRADPALTQLIQQLDPDGRERPAFLHARAGLMSTGAIKVPPDVANHVDDWKSVFAALLGNAPPATGLAVNYSRSAASFVVASAVDAACVAVAKRFLANVPQEEVDALTQVLPLEAEVTLQRDAPALHVTCSDGDYEETPFEEEHPESRRYNVVYYGGSSAQTMKEALAEWKRQKETAEKAAFPTLLPRTEEEARSADAWLDLFECSHPLHGVPPQAEVRDRVRQEVWKISTARERYSEPQNKPAAFRTGCTVEKAPIGVPADTYLRADRMVGTAWIALRRALARDEGLRLADGSVMIPLGGGICAIATVLRFAPAVASAGDASRVSVAVRAVPPKTKEEHWRISQPTSSGIHAGGVTTTFTTPIELFLTGHGVRVTVSFEASPLLLEAASDLGAATAAAEKRAQVARELEAEAARLRLQEDDDDE